MPNMNGGNGNGNGNLGGEVIPMVHSPSLIEGSGDAMVPLSAITLPRVNA